MSLKDKINNIITDLETPSTDYIESLNQQNQWGKILNDKTFKTLNNNIKLLKEILTELVNSGGDSGSDFFIGEYPLSTTIKRDSNDKPYLNVDYNTGGFNTVNGAWRFQADVKKGVKNLSTKNSSVAFYGETLAGIIDSDGSTTQNYFELCSVEFNDFLKSIFGVSTMNDKIVIEKLCGLKFKFTLDVSQIKDTDSINLKYSYTRQSSISNYESVKV